jgi:hypothetical protein
MEDYDFSKVREVKEIDIANWFVQAQKRFKSIEEKLGLYSDSDEFSAQETGLLLEQGVQSGDKRFQAIVQNDRNMYGLLLDLQSAGAQVEKTVELYKELFPESPIMNNGSPLATDLEYVRSRLKIYKPILLDKLCVRDRIMQEVRERTKR